MKSSIFLAIQNVAKRSLRNCHFFEICLQTQVHFKLMYVIQLNISCSFIISFISYHQLQPHLIWHFLSQAMFTTLLFELFRFIFYNHISPDRLDEKRDLRGFNTLRPRQNGHHSPEDILKGIFLNENISILIKISLKFVPKGPINNIPTLVQIMAWCWPGNKPLTEPLMVSLLTHVCVSGPQWVNVKLCQTCRHYTWNQLHGNLINFK